MSIGQNLQKLREEKGLSKQALVDDIGIKYSTYANYESGAREPNSEILILLATYYSVSVDFIMGIDNTKKATPSDEGDLTAEQQKAMSLLDALPDDKKQEALRYLEYLVEKQDNE